MFVIHPFRERERERESQREELKAKRTHGT
jgi:hypothetical protein